MHKRFLVLRSPDADAGLPPAETEDPKQIGKLQMQLQKLQDKLAAANIAIGELKASRADDDAMLEKLSGENDQLKAQLATSNQTIESFKTQAAQASADEIVIREKMKHGLTREQAVSVIHRQRAHDELEKKQAEALKAKAES